MHRRNNKSPFVNLPSEEEINSFDPTSGRECCTADRFTYDVRSRPSTPWNRSAARVFTADFMRCYPLFGKSEAEVLQAWNKHTETLRRQFFDLDKEDIEVAYERKRHRQTERKRQVHGRLILTKPSSHPLVTQLFQRRRSVMLTHLGPADTELLDALGVHGMSTDESDHESGRGEPTYVVRPKRWCSPELHHWLRTLDSLHLAVRYRTHFDATQGGWPHFRVAGRNPSICAPVPGLPINCYSTSLLESYDEFRMSWLHPIRGHDANLKHTPEIIECVSRRIHLSHTHFMLLRLAKKYDLSH